MWGRKPLPQPRQAEDRCKIRVRESSNGKTIEFSKGCTKEQLQIAADALKQGTPIKSDGVDFDN